MEGTQKWLEILNKELTRLSRSYRAYWEDEGNIVCIYDIARSIRGIEVNIETKLTSRTAKELANIGHNAFERAKEK